MIRRAAPLLAPLLLALACNAIVGVEDVRLRKDAGADADEPEVDADEPQDNKVTPESVLEVVAGAEHTCAKKADGTVKCWGHDDRMQTGTTLADAGVLLVPGAVAGIDDALHISAGAFHTCVVRKSGKISCWGENSQGQLGDGNSNTRSRTPVDVSGISDAIAVAGGSTFSCAVRSNGAALCWGQNLAGQFGNGNMSSSNTPVPVSGLTNAIAISAGEAHACAVTSDGKVACWGNGFNGQLGNGSQSDSLVPAVIGSLDDMIAVSASARTTCALKRSGSVFCWGANDFGQLGSGVPNASPNPSPTIVNGLDATAIAAGKDHTCAVRRAGGVACWGTGTRGQLGNGAAGDAAVANPNPVDVSGITNAIGIGAGGDHACAPQRTNAIRCWGANAFGQLGENTVNDEPTPISVVGYP